MYEHRERVLFSFHWTGSSIWSRCSVCGWDHWAQLCRGSCCEGERRPAVPHQAEGRGSQEEAGQQSHQAETTATGVHIPILWTVMAVAAMPSLQFQLLALIPTCNDVLCFSSFWPCCHSFSKQKGKARNPAVTTRRKSTKGAEIDFQSKPL